MYQETLLSKALSSTEFISQYDESCKRLLTNKQILAWIMKSCMEEYSALPVSVIAEHCITETPQISQIPVHRDEVTPKAASSPTFILGSATEDSTLNEGTVTFDICFRALLPDTEELLHLLVNIEAQNDFYPGYPLITRGLYYCCRMISAQYGTEFEGSHYEKIKKVYSIWICPHPSIARRNTINSYSLAEFQQTGAFQENPKHYDLLNTTIICLGTKEDRSDGILKLLEVLLSTERNAEEKRQILQRDFELSMTTELDMEVRHMCNLGEGIFKKGIERGIELGIEQGIERGIEQGIEQGIKQNKQDNISSLMRTLHLSLDDALKALEIPEAEKEHYKNMLNIH